MSTISAANASNLTQFFNAQVALARGSATTSSLGGSVANTPSGASLLNTTNGAIFQMAGLMSKVRSLGSQAGMLNATNTAGVDALRTQVNDALSQFNTIAKSSALAGTTTAATSAATLASGAALSALTAATTSTGAVTTTAPPATLDDLRKTLSTMQTNLHDNISQLGVSVQKALAYNSSITGTQSTVSTAYDANSSLATLWASFAKRSSSSYL